MDAQVTGRVLYPERQAAALTDAFMLTYADVFNTSAKKLHPNRIPHIRAAVCGALTL